jgi:hypothetical protein
LPAQGNFESAEKSHTLTLTMSHNPTRISLVRSISPAKIKKDKFAKIRSQLWLDLFHELQRKILFQQNHLPSLRDSN